jgi:hypothetical protein
MPYNEEFLSTIQAIRPTHVYLYGVITDTGILGGFCGAGGFRHRVELKAKLHRDSPVIAELTNRCLSLISEL